MTEDEPPAPPQQPPLPRATLWVSLLAPPLASIAFALGFVPDGKGMLLTAFLIVWIIGTCTLPFWRGLETRYRGRSVSLLAAGYFIAQIVVCPLVWLGVHVGLEQIHFHWR